MGYVLFEDMLKFGDSIIKTLHNVYQNILAVSVADFISNLTGFVLLPDWLDNVLVWELLFGGGIAFILVYNLVSWVIDVLP